MHTLVKQLAEAYLHLTFREGASFYWSPETSEVFYVHRAKPKQHDSWSLLHETSHALLQHTSYKADLELLHLEVAAWQHAVELAKNYSIVIDDEYVQDCLDTYRDWLYRRSLCPACGNQCLQSDQTSHYSCFNCHTRWHVSPSRFCRPYRRSQNAPKSPTVFALQTRL